ncbi:MAG: ATP-binding protein [Bacteroidaceae bacterium]
MKIKTKIALLIGALLAIIIVLGCFSAQTARNMKNNTEKILADNYNSVKYAQKMLFALHVFHTDSIKATSMFLESIELQKKNITENSESDITRNLEMEYKKFLSDPDKKNFIALSTTINSLILINGDAIEKKSEIATDMANKALIWVVVLAIFSAILALIMLLKIPKALTSPIKNLVDGILEISSHNYDKRLNFNPNSEFGAVSSSFNNMAEELAQFQESSLARIISTKQYMEIIINSIDEPIIGIDNQHIILFANHAASDILNLSTDKMIRKSALDLSLSNDLLRRLIRGLKGENKNEPLKIYSNNKESYFEVHYLSQPENTGTVIRLSNITKFKELDNAKTNFISVISHELKTPIAAIMMSLKLMEDERVGAMNDEQTTLAKSIKENSERLLSISGELLKMTQVETGILQLNPKITKPIELIDYAINATRVLAERFKCNIEIEYPEKIGKIFVDSEKIAWVVTNLLSNAIHYSHENSRVIIGARQIEKTIEIYVRDFGKGIDPRYHKAIFDRYFRVPGTKVQGSGLGLAISKDFIEAHGGTIRIESGIGQGSCFILALEIP